MGDLTEPGAYAVKYAGQRRRSDSRWLPPKADWLITGDAALFALANHTDRHDRRIRRMASRMRTTVRRSFYFEVGIR